MKKQLLCTFSALDLYKKTIEEIKKFYLVVENRFFVFSNTNQPKEVFITYNVEQQNDKDRFPNTISIHRKKYFNVLYSLNALNQLVRDENGGISDKNFSVNWDLYKNSLIIKSDIIKVIPIKMLDIIKIS